MKSYMIANAVFGMSKRNGKCYPAFRNRNGELEKLTGKSVIELGSARFYIIWGENPKEHDFRILNDEAATLVQIIWGVNVPVAKSDELWWPGLARPSKDEVVRLVEEAATDK